MRFSLIRNILAGFLVIFVGFLLACLVTLTLLDRVATQIAQADGLQQALQTIQTGQLIVLLLVLVGLVCGLAAMVYAVHQATRMLERLKLATQQLANVVLDEEAHQTAPGTGDALEDEIQEMMRMIKNSQQMCLDASPLTRLPGNIAIEQVLKEKMERGEKFALCYIDLDDFKAYNDKYGYAQGSELIKITGEIVHNAKDEHANPGDFVGHIGGDDFVLITSPELVPPVCEAIIEAFDQMVPEHYCEEDRQRGYIEGTDRYGVDRRFPLMSLSIAVVTDQRRTFNSPIEIAQVANEIKDYVKSLPGSNYLVDRRTTTRWGE